MGVAIFSMTKISRFLDNFELSTAITLTVAIISLSGRHEDDILA